MLLQQPLRFGDGSEDEVVEMAVGEIQGDSEAPESSEKLQKD